MVTVRRVSLWGAAGVAWALIVLVFIVLLVGVLTVLGDGGGQDEGEAVTAPEAYGAVASIMHVFVIVPLAVLAYQLHMVVKDAAGLQAATPANTTAVSTTATYA